MPMLRVWFIEVDSISNQENANGFDDVQPEVEGSNPTRTQGGTRNVLGDAYHLTMRDPVLSWFHRPAFQSRS